MLLKISSILSFIQYDVNLETGELGVRTSTLSAFLHSVNIVLSLIKGSQLLYSFNMLAQSISTNSKAVTPVVTILIAQGLLITGFIWNWELHRRADELLVLFRSIKLGLLNISAEKTPFVLPIFVALVLTFKN